MQLVIKYYFNINVWNEVSMYTDYCVYANILLTVLVYPT